MCNQSSSNDLLLKLDVSPEVLELSPSGRMHYCPRTEFTVVSTDQGRLGLQQTTTLGLRYRASLPRRQGRRNQRALHCLADFGNGKKHLVEAAVDTSIAPRCNNLIEVIWPNSIFARVGAFPLRSEFQSDIELSVVFFLSTFRVLYLFVPVCRFVEGDIYFAENSAHCFV